jgi:predicted SAM-dependent methyltransferase
MLKLDLGAGTTRIPGYTPVDASLGHDVRSLPFAHNVADEIRASHVLEHIPFPEALATMRHWVDVLRPGGWLRVAVPDFDKIVDWYREGRGDELNLEGFLMGGHSDHMDAHHSIYQYQKLAGMMKECGLEDVCIWEGDADDCSRHPVSLNLKGRKPHAQVPATLPNCSDIHLVQTCPRLGFTDHMYCAALATKDLGINITRHMGVFWTQGMDRIMSETMNRESVKWILTTDYDTVFCAEDIVRMREIAERLDLDILAPMQAGRERSAPLLTIKDENGGLKTGILSTELQRDAIQVATAHFGLTLIRKTALAKVPRPWFVGVPAPDGTWGEGRTDDDITFWRQWEKAGLKAWLTPKVQVGHAELVVAWIDRDLKRQWQSTSEYYSLGKPYYARS